VAGARGHVWTGLDHPEGQDGAGKHVSAAGDAEHRVDIRSVIHDWLGYGFGDMLDGVFGGLALSDGREQDNR
jgi:hypothetical protein